MSIRYIVHISDLCAAPSIVQVVYQPHTQSQRFLLPQDAPQHGQHGTVEACSHKAALRTRQIDDANTVLVSCP